MRWPSWLNQKKATGTWIGHPLVSLAAAVVVGVLSGLKFGYSQEGAVVASIIVAAYFNFIREPEDREKHKEAGDYDEPQPGGGATSREDMVGDLVGVNSFAAGALVVYLLGALL